MSFLETGTRAKVPAWQISLALVYSHKGTRAGCQLITYYLSIQEKVQRFMQSRSDNHLSILNTGTHAKVRARQASNVCVRTGRSKTLISVQKWRILGLVGNSTTNLTLYQTSFPQIVIEMAGKVCYRVPKKNTEGSPSRTWFAMYNLPNSDASDLMFNRCLPFFFSSMDLLSVGKPFVVIWVLSAVVHPCERINWNASYCVWFTCTSYDSGALPWLWSTTRLLHSSSKGFPCCRMTPKNPDTSEKNFR